MVTVSASIASYIRLLPSTSRAWCSRAWWRSDPTIASAGQADQGQEEVVDLADCLDEVLEIDRLAHERVGVQRVAAHDVLLGPGRGEHDHGDEEKVGVLLQLGEHFQAVAPRRVDVE